MERTGWAGLTRAWENQLLPGLGPKKSPARSTIVRTLSRLASASRLSSSTLIVPLRVSGCWGESSRRTGVKSDGGYYCRMAAWTVEHTPQGSFSVRTDGQPANVLPLAAISEVTEGRAQVRSGVCAGSKSLRL